MSCLSPEEYEEAIKLVCGAGGEIDIFFDEPFFWAVVSELGLKMQKPMSQSGVVVSQTTACIIGEYLFIEPNGDVKPCVFAPLILGNAGNESLERIWHKSLSSPFLHRLSEAKTRGGYCQSCYYLDQCKGCRSRTVALTGDWFASDPACPLASKLGVKNASYRY